MMSPHIGWRDSDLGKEKWWIIYKQSSTLVLVNIINVTQPAVDQLRYGYNDGVWKLYYTGINIHGIHWVSSWGFAIWHSQPQQLNCFLTSFTFQKEALLKSVFVQAKFLQKMAFRVIRPHKEARRNAKLNEIFEVLFNFLARILMSYSKTETLEMTIKSHLTSLWIFSESMR